MSGCRLKWGLALVAGALSAMMAGCSRPRGKLAEESPSSPPSTIRQACRLTPAQLFPDLYRADGPRGLINGKSKSVRGVDVRLGVSWAEQRLAGAQVSGVCNFVGQEEAEGLANGAQVCPFLNVISGHLNGLQLSGLVNFSSGKLNGLQLSGTSNIGGAVNGAQICGLPFLVFAGNSAGVVNGLQAGVLNGGCVGRDFVNGARAMNGVQVGVAISRAGRANGLQVSGFANSVRRDDKGRKNSTVDGGRLNEPTQRPHMNGVQIAGMVNRVDGPVKGGQIGVGYNWAREVRGLQIGLVNACNELHGLQLGLINIRSGMRVPFVPLLNFRFQAKPSSSGQP